MEREADRGSDGVRQERSGWRDEALSRRHRDWGFDCPAVDIDFLMVEYDRAEPIAVIEYKSAAARPVTSGHPSYRAISKLCDPAGVKFFGARYAPEFDRFRVVGLNGLARMDAAELSLPSEVEYVKFLYWLRGRSVPQEVLAKL